MSKRKFYIEHELRCKSANIIWPLISTPAGMTKWIADEVKGDGSRLTFRWGEVWGHHEIRVAAVIGEEKNSWIRMRWEDEDDDAAYFEIAVEKSELTGEYVMVITDFAEEDDVGTLKDLWEADLRRLRHASGL